MAKIRGRGGILQWQCSDRDAITDRIVLRFEEGDFASTKQKAKEIYDVLATTPVGLLANNSSPISLLLMKLRL